MKKQSFIGTIKAILFSMRLALRYQEGRRYCGMKLFLAILNVIYPLATTLLPGLIINELMEKRRISVLTSYVLLLGVIPLMNTAFGLLTNRYMLKLSKEIELIYTSQWYLMRMKMDYEHLENPKMEELHDRCLNTYISVAEIIDQIIALFATVINVIALSSIVITFNPLILVVILVMMWVNFVVTKHTQQKLFQANKGLERYDRMLSGLTFKMIKYQNGKEFRLFDLGQYLVDRYRSIKKELIGHEIENRRISHTSGMVVAITSFLQQIILYAFLIFQILYRGLSVGDLTICLSAGNQFASRIKSLFDAYLALYRRSLSIQELKEYLSIPVLQYQTGNRTPHFDRNSVIEFKNVSFRYPGSDRYALKNLNLTLRGNEKLCVVGANGSGKTTFVKLLTRLYLVQEGEILLNGINIKEYDYLKYQRLFAAVFQDFIQYNFSLKDNIVLNQEYDQVRLDKVCKNTGLTSLVEKLPQGYETQVGKFVDPNGFDPSGGESQRIAIARACYRGGDIFLLDEPTAALDPIAEYDIYTQFNQMITDKCAVLVTHRLSAVQLADKVAVFKNGSVVEYGSHQELYSKGGIYTEMFDKQAQFYRESSESL